MDIVVFIGGVGTMETGALFGDIGHCLLLEKKIDLKGFQSSECRVFWTMPMC